jgi:uncharacterized protein YjbJ (UPF0337 family)
MDRDPVAGAARQVMTSVKETVGKVGDARIQAEGVAGKAEGQAENAARATAHR